MDSLSEIEDYLHRQMPLSAAMQVTVQSAAAEAVVLGAPLEPNINHKNTAFGGSVATLGILAAWSLVHLRLLEEGCPSEIVIQSSQMDYVRPITGGFTARASLVDASAWPAFLKLLTRRGRARIEVRSQLLFDGAAVGSFSGKFVAFLRGAIEPG